MLWRASRHFTIFRTYPGVSITVLKSRSLFRDSFRQCLAASTVGDFYVCVGIEPARLLSSSSSVGCSKSSQRVVQVVEHSSNPLSSAPADNVELRTSNKTFRSNGAEWVSVRSNDDDRRSLLRRQKPGKKSDRRQLGVIPIQDNLRRLFRKYFVDKFLPNGYPNSVGEGYAKYSGLSFIGTTSSSIMMVLSTQALLQAVGLSDGVALGISATLNWVIKDGIGQFGGIMFASYLGKTKSFDMDPKRWRFLSSLAMDLATFIEIISPAFPGSFLFLASLANIGKNVSFLSASASRAALHQSLAQRNNLADITAMAGSQSIAASLIGTSLGCIISPLVGIESLKNLLISFVLMSSVHQIAVYHSLKAVALKTLNEQRLFHLLEVTMNQPKDGNFNIAGANEVSKLEKFLPFQRYRNTWLHVGKRVQEFCPDASKFEGVLAVMGDDCMYFINIQSDPSNKRETIFITFKEGVSDIDFVRGIFHCFVIRKHCNDMRKPDTFEPLRIVQITNNYVKTSFPSFANQMQHHEWQFRKEDFDHEYDDVRYYFDVKVK